MSDESNYLNELEKNKKKNKAILGGTVVVLLGIAAVLLLTFILKKKPAPEVATSTVESTEAPLPESVDTSIIESEAIHEEVTESTPTEESPEVNTPLETTQEAPKTPPAKPLEKKIGVPPVSEKPVTKVAEPVAPEVPKTMPTSPPTPPKEKATIASKPPVPTPTKPVTPPVPQEVKTLPTPPAEVKTPPAPEVTKPTTKPITPPVVEKPAPTKPVVPTEVTKVAPSKPSPANTSTPPATPPSTSVPTAKPSTPPVYEPENLKSPRKERISEEIKEVALSTPTPQPIGDVSVESSSDYKLGLQAFQAKNYVNTIQLLSKIPKPETKQRGNAQRDEYVMANVMLGSSFQKEGRLSEAISAYQKVLEYEKYYPIVSLNIGICYLELNQYAKADKAFKDVIRDQNRIPPSQFDDTMQRTRYFWALAWSRLYKATGQPDKKAYFQRVASEKWDEYLAWYGNNSAFAKQNEQAKNYLKMVSGN